ncbi:hypothetical protein V7S43_004517 [Phytophthora oleae]|uniref:Uncharacterized protein n=1 Tax=Phytophthora oleae TaxID=2107226 RepID=A0ABD3FZ05_9STRA
MEFHRRNLPLHMWTHLCSDQLYDQAELSKRFCSPRCVCPFKTDVDLGDPGITVPSNKTYNDILDAHYEQFRKDAEKLFAEEQKELYGTAFMALEQVNASTNCIVGASCGFVDHT